jgi:mannose/fructose/N-acetylgalactosamine-specific phosphotransferase system component IIC
MTFWKKKKAQVEQAVDDVAVTATDLAEKTLTIGAGGVLLMLGAAAVGAAAAYVASKQHQKKKAARSKAASSKSDKSA